MNAAVVRARVRVRVRAEKPVPTLWLPFLESAGAQTPFPERQAAAGTAHRGRLKARKRGQAAGGHGAFYKRHGNSGSQPNAASKTHS